MLPGAVALRQRGSHRDPRCARGGRNWLLFRLSARLVYRVSAAIRVACLTRYQNLIRHGQLRQHGVYHFVDGLLRHCDTEAVLALLAPRPFLALTGDLDAGSPADEIKILEEKIGRVYKVVGAAARQGGVSPVSESRRTMPTLRSVQAAVSASRRPSGCPDRSEQRNLQAGVADLMASYPA